MGVGNTSTDQNATHAYTSSGVYNVFLNITNSTGSWSNISKVQNVTAGFVADFGSDPSPSFVNELVSFSDLSSGSPTTWNWTFGDIGAGNTSTDQNPTHTYTIAGNYNVFLNVTNSTGYWSNKSRTQVVSDFLAANFTSAANPALVNVALGFSDTSVGGPVTWNWTFGDIGAGNTSTLQNPTHTYTVSGTYTVFLNITNSTGYWSNISKTQTIAEGFLADFSSAPNPSLINDLVTFSDLSSGDVSTWNWTFGDLIGGNTSTLQNPTHIYVTSGNYSVFLNVTNSTGYWSNRSKTQVVYDLLSANFTSAPNPALSGSSVFFTDLTVGGPITWSWTFGDIGTGNTSTLQNPTHTYGSFGTYSVFLNATNATGYWSNISKTQVITETFMADFSSTPNPSITNTTALFNDTSVGTPFTWNWTFGDLGAGNTSTDQNPYHTYTAAGSYNVFLNITNSTGYWSNTSKVHVVEDVTLTIEIRDMKGQKILNGDAATSDGQTQATMDGLFVFYYGYIPGHMISVNASADGYTTATATYILDLDDEYQILYLAGSGVGDVSEDKVNYVPHFVRFITIDYAGQPVSGVEVSAEGVSSTATGEWWYELLGIDTTDTGNSPSNMTFTGTTGTDGSVNFLMLETVKYQVSFENVVKGVNESLSFYPKEDSYLVVVGTTAAGDLDSSWGAGSAYITRDLYSNQSGTQLTLYLDYLDPERDTTSIYFYVENGNHVLLNETTYLGYANNFSYVVNPFTHGETYYYGYTSTNTNYGTLSGNAIVTTHSRIVAPLETMGWDTSWYMWITIICLVCFVAIVSGTTSVYGTLTFPLWSLFFGFLGWLDWCPWEFILGVAILGVMVFVVKMYARTSDG